MVDHSPTPWNFNMDEAPKGKWHDVEDNKGKTKRVFIAVKLFAARGGCLTYTRWIPDEERWEFFTKDHPPEAWMPWIPPLPPQEDE